MMNTNCNPSRKKAAAHGKRARTGCSASPEPRLAIGTALPHVGSLVEPAPSAAADMARLPMRSDTPTAAGDRTSPAELRILVVDDEPGIRHALRRMLGRRHRVETAENGREAFERLSAGGRFDVILCDLMMPEMTGVQLYEALSAEAPGVTARIVFMTGGVFSQQTRDFLEGVSNPLLEKPLNWESLRLAFHVVLERARRPGGSDEGGD